MRLEAETPEGILHAVRERSTRIDVQVRPVHRLQEEVVECEVDERLRRCARLRVHQFEFVSLKLHQGRSGLGAYADPVDASGDLQRSVRFHCDFESVPVQCLDEGGIQLQKRLPSRADDEGATRTSSGPVTPSGLCEKRCGFELPTSRTIGSDEVCVAKPAYGRRPIRLSAGPQVTPGKPEKDGGASRMCTLSLERIEDFFDRVRHDGSQTVAAGPGSQPRPKHRTPARVGTVHSNRKELDLRSYLESLVHRFERASFIDTDPISLPHAFDDPGDQEVVALFAALLAWGRRETAMSKTAELCERMRFRPYRFLYDFNEARDAPRLAGFRHRTFQPVDALWMARSLAAILRRFGSLERVFADGMSPESRDVGPAIQHFSETVVDIVPGFPARTTKHLARPATGSACKRLSMFLRWMVRPGPVDLGLWSSLYPAQLVLPLDVHSGRTARALGLLARRQDDWRAVHELTLACRMLSPEDPCRYDYAFFGTGIGRLALDPYFLIDGVGTSLKNP